MRVILGTYAFRFPLGGNLSWTIQWAVGLQRLGHQVILAEKSEHPDDCFDPVGMRMTGDCTAALASVAGLLDRYGLSGRWCFVDQTQTYHGRSQSAIEQAFSQADLFIDLGTHGAWMQEAALGSCTTVLVDGEPGYTQMRRALKAEHGEQLPEYDHYFSNGALLGTSEYLGPTNGIVWGAVFNPVVIDLMPLRPPNGGGRFTTVMQWQAHRPLTYDGTTWRQKDVEFTKFIDLPRRAGEPIELAVGGPEVPWDLIHEAGWSTRDAVDTTRSYDKYLEYVADSAGEFSVCKQGYVSLRTGWFSDRSAAYLGSGRPVIMQDTGFAARLPCGEGLFAVTTVEEAADAIAEIRADYELHSAAAKRIAREHLEAGVVLPRFLDEIGA
jgi:hypothetical protein